MACAEREAFEEAGIRVRIVGYLGHWIDEYLPAATTVPSRSTARSPITTPSRANEPAAIHDAVEVAEVAWFGPDEIPTELAPPGNGPSIYAAWREAFLAGTTETPLPDR